MGDIHNHENFTLLDAFLTNKDIPLKEFYMAEYPKTRSYILKNGGTPENSRDIFQEAYLDCWKKLCDQKFKPKRKGDIEAYLFTIAKNKWIDLTRKMAKRKTLSIEGNYLHLAVEDPAQTAELEKRETQISITLSAFEKLGPACKDLLTQFYFYKIPLRRIAEKLDLQEASAKNKKYRCIQKLKELALAKETKS